jgi:hypothetical protein
MPGRQDKINPWFSVEDEKSGIPAPKYESSESLPQTISTGDLIAPKEGLEESDNENPHADGYFDANGKYIRSHGLNWIITGLFVVGDLAGGGLVALPTAMIQSGEFCAQLSNSNSTLQAFGLG